MEAAAGQKIAELPPFIDLDLEGLDAIVPDSLSPHDTLPLPENTVMLLPIYCLLLNVYSQFVLPSHMMGPDTVGFLKHVLVIVGDKTTNRQDRSVDANEVWDNFTTMDISSCWSSRHCSDARRAFREYICDKVRLGDLKGIIRIHIVFPSASRNTSAYFKPGKILYLCF